MKFVRIAMAMLLLAVAGASHAATAIEQNIALVYLGVFGRAPDLDGLRYWRDSAGLPYNASLEATYDKIAGAVAGSYLSPVNESDRKWVEYIYTFVLGRAPMDDDVGGIDYWTSRLATESRGHIFATIIGAIEGTTGTDEASVRNKQKYLNRKALVFEAVDKQQQPGRQAIPASGGIFGNAIYITTQSLARRVIDTPASLSAARADLDLLTTPGYVPPATRRWSTSYSASTIWSGTEPLVGSTSRINRSLVWYNRRGNMMIANVVVPSNYPYLANAKAVISVFGGGWRNGNPEQIQRYNKVLAENGFVVFAPTYRTTAMGGREIELQEDIEDFTTLVKAYATSFNVNTNNVFMFGESAGAQLVAQLGARTNYRCVVAWVPPLDLEHSTTALQPYVNKYLTGDFSVYPAAGEAQSYSPTKMLANVGTSFQIRSYYGDPLSGSGADDFASRAGVLGIYADVVTRAGVGHPFNDAAADVALSEAVTFFNGSHCSY